MKYSLFVRTASVLMMLCATGCSTGADILRETYHLKPGYKFKNTYTPVEIQKEANKIEAAEAAEAEDEASEQQACSLFKRFRQKDVYVYEPEDSTVTWRLKAKFDVDYGSARVEMKHIMLRFEMPIGYAPERKHDSKRKCRGQMQHGGYLGAFLPMSDHEAFQNVGEVDFFSF